MSEMLSTGVLSYTSEMFHVLGIPANLTVADDVDQILEQLTPVSNLVNYVCGGSALLVAGVILGATGALYLQRRGKR